MFARITALPDLGYNDNFPNGDLALAWLDLQNSQSVVARRQRLNCPPINCGAVGGTTNSTPQHRWSIVCCSSGGRHQRSARATSKRPANHYSTGFRASSSSAGHHAATLAPQTWAQRPCQQQVPKQAISSVDPQQLLYCIQAAATFSQLEAVCNTFLGHPAFGSHHAACVLSRLHLVRSRPEDAQLLLVELLAQQLPAGCTNSTTAAAPAASDVGNNYPQQQQLTCSQVGAVCWAFARAGYQPTACLLQQLLQQFWLDFKQQQEQQDALQQPHQQDATSSNSSSSSQQQWPSTSCFAALATLAAGLAGLGVRDPSTWSQLRTSAQAAAARCALPAHSLQQLVWGFAAVQQSDAATTAALAAALNERLHELETAEDLVQTVWSLHLMGCQDSMLFERAAQLMVDKVQSTGSNHSSSSSRSSVRTGRAAGSQSAVLGSAANGQQQCHQHVTLPPLSSAGACVAEGLRSGVEHTMQASNGAQQHQHQCGSTYQVQQHHTALLQAPYRDRTTRQQEAPAATAASRQLLSAAAGQTSALCSAAASKAFGVLQQCDPLLCMLALYREYHQPAHAC